MQNKKNDLYKDYDDLDWDNADRAIKERKEKSIIDIEKKPMFFDPFFDLLGWIQHHNHIREMNELKGNKNE